MLVSEVVIHIKLGVHPGIFPLLGRYGVEVLSTCPVGVVSLLICVITIESTDVGIDLCLPLAEVEYRPWVDPVKVLSPSNGLSTHVPIVATCLRSL